MKNMKVAKKLIVGFLIVIVLAAAVGAAGIIGLSSMSNAAEHMYTDMGVPLGDLGLATEYFQRIRVQMRNAIIYTGDAGHLATVEADLTDRMAQFEADMDKYEPTLATEEGRRLFTETMSEFEGVVKPGIAAMMENAYQGMPALQLLDSIAPITAAADTIATDLRELTQVRLQSMSDANDGTTDLFVSLLVVIVAAIVIAIGASLFLALYISRLIAKPLIPLTSFMQRAGATGDISLDEEDARVIASYGKNKDEIGQTIAAAASFVTRVNVVSGALQTIAGGDLTAELEPLSDRDTLGVSLKKMSESLNGMFGEVNASSSQVSVGASQVADGAQALAQGATEQAATIEELSSSIAEIAQHTKENAAKAEEAAVLAETIKGNAEKGSGQMDEMIDAVRAISQSSQDISKVIKVINDIAFQTNILALNAAVEAARAGQHGKGFAVVADEVRNLAAKSAEAASDTESMIANSIEKADLGVRIADETSASLSQIVDGINTSSQLVGEIAALSEGQATAVGQINTGIDQVAQVIQQNSATAEESAAAAQEMSGQSDVLRELIAQFKIKGVEIPARLALSAADRRQLPAAQDVIF